MPDSCCPPDHRGAIDERYGAAALVKEPCLCTAVPFDPALLRVIPEEVVSRDYGCGDPTRWVRPGNRVLDLGSGSGKNAFICSQLVGAEGSVLGLDRNLNMLDLANGACPQVASQIGYANVSFRRAEIDQLARDLDGQPLLSDACIDVVLSNCVLNLVEPTQRPQLLQEIRRVTAPGGRLAISDIICDKPVPVAMQQDPALWSGCISGAWLEAEFCAAFEDLGFRNVSLVDRQENPWQVHAGIEFRSATLIAELPCC